MVKKIRGPALVKRKEVEKDLKQKLNMFDRLPDYCLTCDKPFDKTDVQEVSTWRVVVKKETETVRLYCPECFNAVTEIVKDFKKRVEERKSVSGSIDV